MYLHFEDWSPFLSRLKEKKLPHRDKLIKVFATFEDPRKSLRRELSVIEEDDSPFREDETFSYSGRPSFSGKKLEDELARRGFDERTKQTVRALFRFANRKEVQATQAAMKAKEGGVFLFNHPFEDIDGLKSTGRFSNHPEHIIHLDIFFPETLERIRRLVDLDDQETVLSMMEGTRSRIAKEVADKESTSRRGRIERI